MIRSALMNVMTAAALKAGRGLKRDFGEVENLQVSVKGPGDFVSAADRKAEKILFEELSKARPGYGFLMEESGVVEGSDKSHIWYVDPLDGTANFLHGLPNFGISIGLARDEQIVAGLVYNPVIEALYVAEKGQGAYLNNRRLRVASRRDLGEALIGCAIPHLGKAGHARFKAELCRRDGARRQSTPAGRGGTRSLFRSSRRLRRVLGTRPEALGSRGGNFDRQRGGRVRDRCRRRLGYLR